MPPEKKRTAALIRWQLHRAEYEVEKRRNAPGNGPDHDAAWRALTPDVDRLRDELTEAEIAEEKVRQRLLRQTVYWAAIAAIASAVAAVGTWLQATHAPPVRIELVQSPPAPARGPGPWSPDPFSAVDATRAAPATGP